MNLEERLKEDLKQAMRDKDKMLLNTLRAVKGAYQLEAINKNVEVNDDLILTIIQKQVKMREESICEFEKGGRDDLKESYAKEIAILKKYLPEPLSEEELKKIVQEAFTKVNPASIKDMGKLMQEITPKVKNRCDMKSLNQKIKDKLLNKE